MDLYTLALSIAYTNKAIKAAELEGFKVQVETTRDILETVGEEKTFYFLPKVVSEPQNGYDEYIYVNDSWELMGSTDIDLSSYMTLAPLDPTAEQIAALSNGQLYGDTINHKGIIKGGQEFYDTQKIDELIANKQNRIYYEQPKNDFNSYHDDGSPYAVGDLFIDDGTLYKLHTGFPDTGLVFYNRSILGNKVSIMDPPTSSSAAYACKYAAGDIYKKYDTPEVNNIYVLVKCYVCKRVFNCVFTTGHHTYEWQEIPIDIYSKTEIDSMIGDIGTALDTLNDNLAEV